MDLGPRSKRIGSQSLGIMLFAFHAEGRATTKLLPRVATFVEVANVRAYAVPRRSSRESRETVLRPARKFSSCLSFLSNYSRFHRRKGKGRKERK